MIVAVEDQSVEGKGDHYTTLDNRKNISNTLSTVNYEREAGIYERGTSIDKRTFVTNDRGASNDRENESRYDEKGTELAAMRIQGRSSDPVIVKFENLNPNAGKIIHKSKI